MRRYVLLFFVCISVIAACSPRYYHGERAAMAFNQEQQLTNTSMQEWLEQYIHKELQEWKEVHKWTDQILVKEVLSEPDSTGAQYVKERVSKTTHQQAIMSAGRNTETTAVHKEQLDSTGTDNHSSSNYAEENASTNFKKQRPIPLCVLIAALAGAFLAAFIMIRKTAFNNRSK